MSIYPLLSYKTKIPHPKWYPSIPCTLYFSSVHRHGSEEPHKGRQNLWLFSWLLIFRLFQSNNRGGDCLFPLAPMEVLGPSSAHTWPSVCQNHMQKVTQAERREKREREIKAINSGHLVQPHAKLKSSLYWQQKYHNTRFQLLRRKLLD